MTVRGDLLTIDAIAPNFGRRYSGVTTTILSVAPRQAKKIRIATLGSPTRDSVAKIGWAQILRHGWTRPPGRPFRIWHARRNIELMAGMLLRDVLRQPWKIVFTSAAQRDHSAYTKWLIRRTDAVIATSPQAAGFLEVPSTIISHGIDLQRCRPAEDRAAEWAAGGLPGRFGVGVFGRIRSQKGTDLFVEAMFRLLPKYPDFTAVVIGLATDRHRAFLKQLKNRIRHAGLQDRILFLGELPTDDIPVWFRRMTIYVAPQRHEGFGLTPLEAMASGAAVVATRAGTFESQIVDGETGLLVDPSSADELANALDTLMADPARAEEMGRNGRSHVSARFDVETEAASICDVYERLWSEAPVTTHIEVVAEHAGKFGFSPADLNIAVRKPGISAFMRIRNGADFLEPTIRSHIHHFDEIVAVHNRCTDETPDILARLAQEFGPEKLRVFHYEPEVFPQGSTGHRYEPAGSPHSVVNYSNFALARTSQSIVVKLDDDHLAIEPAVTETVGRIRNGGLRRDELLCFSGFNLMRDEGGRLGIRRSEPFSGSGDIGFFHITPETYFVHDPRFETFRRANLSRRFAGYLYWHLKYMKGAHGFGNYDFADNPKSRYLRKQAEFLANRAIYPIDSVSPIGGAAAHTLARLTQFMPVPEKIRLLAERLTGTENAFGGKPPADLLSRSAPHAPESVRDLLA